MEEITELVLENAEDKAAATTLNSDKFAITHLNTIAQLIQPTTRTISVERD